MARDLSYRIVETEDDVKIKCLTCSKLCDLIAFTTVPPSVLNKAIERKLYVGETEEGEHVIAVCSNCVKR